MRTPLAPELITAVGNTLLLCGLVCTLAVPVGGLLAILLARTNVLGRELAWLCLGSQIAVPLYVFAGGWCAAIGTQGWIQVIFPGLFSGSQSIGNVLVVAAVHALASIPWVCLLTALGLVWTDRGTEDTAVVEGGLWFLLVHVLLPRLRIWLLAACLWCCFPVLTEMVVTNLFQVPSVSELVYLDASRGVMTPATYLAGGLFCVLPLLGFGWFWLRTAPPWSAVVERASHFRPPLRSLGRWRMPVSVGVWAFIGVFVFLPLLSLVAKAGWKPSLGEDGLTHYGWSASRFATTVTEGLTLFGAEYYWSTVIGLAAITLAGGIAASLFLLATSRPALRHSVSLVMLVFISLPGPLVGVLVIYLLNRDTPPLGYLYDNTILAPVLAQQFRLLPLAWLLCISLAATIDTGTRQQMRLDGVTGLVSGCRVLWPQLGSRVAGCLLLLFVISVGELSCSILVLPPGVTTTAMRLFEMLHFGMRHQDSALCGVLVLLGWGVSFTLRKTLSERN